MRGRVACLLAAGLALGMASERSLAMPDTGRLPPGDAQAADTPDAVRAWLDFAIAIGAWGEALRLVGRHPEQVDPATRLRIEQSATALAIRQGAALKEADVPPERDARLDAALAASAIHADTPGEPDEPARAAHALRIDRIVALRERGRFREAVRLRNAIAGQHDDGRHDAGTPARPVASVDTRSSAAPSTSPDRLPDFALAAAADSWLALREPERARDDYLAAIAGRRSPVAWDWRIGLAYAELESERPDDAARTLALLDDDVRAAFRDADTPAARASARHWIGRVGVLRANFDRYRHRSRAASDRIATLERETPFDMDTRAARVATTIDEGRPDSALAQAIRLRIDHPDSIWPRVTEIEARVAAGDYRAARLATDELALRESEPQQAERLGRRARRDAAGRVIVEAGLSLGDGPQTSSRTMPVREEWLETRIESRRFDDAWRLIGFTRRTTSDADGLRSHRTRLGAGLRHEAGRLMAEGMLATGLRGDTHGGTAALRLRVHDGLFIGARHTYDDDAVPVRAYRDGVRLDRSRLDLDWRATATTRLGASAAVGHFTDGNRREELALGWSERWFDSPRIAFDSRLSLERSTHSTDAVRYFSPREDLTASLSLIASHRLHRHYDTDWVHRLAIGPTWHRQAGFGEGQGYRIRYAHEFEIAGRWGGRIGVELVGRPYDGRDEVRRIASLTLHTRF